MTGKYGRREEKTLKRLLLDGKLFCLAVEAHKAADYELEVPRKRLLKLLKDEGKVEELLTLNPGKIIRGEQPIVV